MCICNAENTNRKPKFGYKTVVRTEDSIWYEGTYTKQRFSWSGPVTPMWNDEDSLAPSSPGEGGALKRICSFNEMHLGKISVMLKKADAIENARSLSDDTFAYRHCVLEVWRVKLHYKAETQGIIVGDWCCDGGSRIGLVDAIERDTTVAIVADGKVIR